MRVLITGAAGFIGSHLCERFLRNGHEVIGLDNFLTGSPDNIAHLFENPSFTFIKYDVTNFVYVEGELDLILHFACPASPVDYLNHPIHTMKVDSLGTLHTLGLAKLKGARYVFASTSEVYGNPTLHPQPETYWGNVNPIGPRSVYDEAKRFSEALTMAYHREHGIDVRIARIFNTYGPRMRMNDGRVVPNFITQALMGKPLTVYGDGSQTRSFCYIDDLVEGIYRLATYKDLAGEVFNLGNPEEYSVLELAKLVIELTGSGSEIVFRERPVDDPDRRKPDITKARRILEWEPRTPVREGLVKTIEWFRDKI
ncbi:dTDP-glucose 4,6-dehydratase [Hydrogenivirga caldilitoris]|uniref:UDP-glucuronate decarboxylase n=1 Tax=Hydrogenivirga caldilitoris TaxID=246264 RepID=A0A497XST3_9AQUI|nr:UDP-glucuronic acid decarboxylase family protein [Hydrogenivirga caldilitoris]RLJ71321.1 dTDP-glucose 4,6-dehydratase [Hydrogenivirga caldilitoris]